MTENTDIAVQSPTGKAVAATSPLGETGALLDAMMALAKDPTVDAAKFETIARVVSNTREEAKKEQFYQDKAAAMLDMPVIDKRGKITIEKNGQTRIQGTYAVWSDLQRAIAPVLARYNLAITHDIGHEGAICLVTPVLQHRNGYVEKGDRMALPLDQSGGKNSTQGAGSAASYGKRHTTIAMLGIRLEDTDDDGWLTATADEPLNDQQARRVAEAEARWADGPEAYEAWFQKLEPKDRAWMIQTGRHKSLTGEAAGILIAGAAGHPVERKDAQRPAPTVTAGGHDVNTAGGWTAQYEEDCAACQSLDELAMIQRKGAKGLARLKEADATLYERAVAAGTNAHARLSTGGDA